MHYKRIKIKDNLGKHLNVDDKVLINYWVKDRLHYTIDRVVGFTNFKDLADPPYYRLKFSRFGVSYKYEYGQELIVIKED